MLRTGRPLQAIDQSNMAVAILSSYYFTEYRNQSYSVLQNCKKYLEKRFRGFCKSYGTNHHLDD